MSREAAMVPGPSRQGEATVKLGQTAPAPADGGEPRGHTVPTAGVGGNARLTAMTGLLLLALLVLEIASAAFFFLLAANLAALGGPAYDVIRPVHFFVGFLLMPLVAIKLVSTGYRFGRYYLRAHAYHEAGPPRPVPRIIAPVLIGSSVTLFGSGVEMWSFRNQFGYAWTAIHNTSAVVFTATLAVHIAVHVREAHRNAAAELAGTPIAVAGAEPAEPIHEPLGGTVTRRSLLGGGLAFGAVLGAGASGFPVRSWAFLQPMRPGEATFDFPIMNFEGGAQKVDVTRWRLRIAGSVAHPLELTEAELLSLPAEEHRYAISCVDGWTAERTWRGVPVARLLRMAGADRDFGHVLIRSTSGYFWDHDRSHVLAGGALVCTHINGERLNDDHGYPARLIIPGLLGQSQIKWIDELDVGHGGPQNFAGPRFDFRNPVVTGHLLDRDPAGMRP
jgi:molybdopterin-dependent oxidoreductase-like protein protein